jgi:SET domain-containing protein
MASEPAKEVWVHPGVVVARSGIEGDGLQAREAIAAGVVVLRLGGRLVSTTELEELIAAADAAPDNEYVDTTTVDDDRHLVLPSGTVAHFANHSCDPNLWHDGPFVIVARRDIAAGEELTIDYGTSSGAPGFRMACACGSAECRGEVTSDDWAIRALQARYRGHWVPALECRISQATT